MKFLSYFNQLIFTGLGVLLLSGYRPVSQEILIVLFLLSGIAASLLFMLYSKTTKEVITVEKVREESTEQFNENTNKEVFINRFKQKILHENLKGEEGLKSAFNFLSEAMQAGQALFHEACQGENNTPALKIKFTYAYYNPENKQDEIAFGDGLLGAAAEENKIMKFSDFPVNYLNGISGLGGARTFTLIIIPINSGDKVNAVIEIGSFIKSDEIGDSELKEIAEIFSGLIGGSDSENKNQEIENVEEY